jgi:MFS family permease
MPFVGRFVDERGVRLAQTLVGLAFAGALVVMSGVNGLLWLMVGFAGIRMFGQGSLSMISTVTVALWFSRRRGMAMGLLTTVAGALMALLPVALNAVIGFTSWRTAWLIAAAAVAVTVIPIARFGLIDRPSDIGQVPDGPRPDDPRPDDPSPGPAVDPSTGPGAAGLLTRLFRRPRPVSVDTGSYTRREAASTLQFWILAAIGIASGMLITGLNFHQIDLLGEAGLSSGQAAAMFLPQIVGSSVAAIATGLVLDQVGVRYVPAFSMLLLVIVHLVAAGLDQGAMVILYAVLLGSIGGMVRSTLSTMLPGYFGVDHIGSIQGLLTVTMVGGSALGPVTLAVAQEWTGSYRTANLWLMMIPLAMVALTLLNRPLPARS